MDSMITLDLMHVYIIGCLLFSGFLLTAVLDDSEDE